MNVVTNILVGTDLDERSAGPIRYASALAEQIGAHLVAVHVASVRGVELTRSPEHGLEAEPEHAAAADERLTDRIHREAQEELEAQLRELLGDERAAACTAEVRLGHTSSGILAAAAAHECDLIVVTVESRSRVGKLLLGSHAQELLLTSELPVVGVKPDWVPAD